jgi:hypothetical protein
MELIAYHSTSQKNISDILKNGFKENFGKGFGTTFGNGIYTSPDIKYVSTYNIECDKILVCKIKPGKTKKINIKEFLYLKRKYKNELENLDLLIILDANEYICKNVNCIMVIQVITIDRIIKKDKDGRQYLHDIIIKETLDI